MMQPDQTVTLTLTASDCQVLLAALGETPYRIAAPVIDKIRRDILAVDAEAFAPPPALINGAAHAPD
jgi:hypothetical protein